MTSIIHLVKWFGISRFPLKQILAAVEVAVGSKQAAVRKVALSFYEECYKWIGDAIKPAVEKLNKPQQDELEKLFNSIKEKNEPKPRATRVTKNEEESKKQAELDEITAKEEEEEKQQIEALDLAEDKDALANFGESWADQVLKLKKWNEKKEMLEKLTNEFNTPKIVPNGNVGAVMRVFEAMIKDSNMNVYDETVKAIGNLANGLRRNFHEEAKNLVGPIISKIKKRPNIIQNVSETLEKMLQWFDLEDVIPLILPGLKDRNPLIVKQYCEFWKKAVQQTYIDDFKKLYNSLCPDIAKLADHQDGELRDLGLSILGLFKARIGDGMEKYLGNLNQQKLEKVNEAASEVKLTKYDKPKNPPKKKAKKENKKVEVEPEAADMMNVDAAPQPKKKKKGKGPPASFFERQQKMQAKAQEKFEEMKAEVKGEAPPPKAEPKSTPAVKNDPPASMGAPSVQDEKPKSDAPRKKIIAADDSGPGVAKEDAVDIVVERCPGAIIKQFDETKWQEKKEAYTKFAAWMIQQEYSNELFEASFWYIRIKQKDFKEKNVNIVKGALSCLSDVITATPTMSKKAATIILPFLSESIGDVKYNAICNENLLSLSELVSPGFVVKALWKHASSAKSPNVLIENNKMIKTVMDEFGTKGLPVQDMINYGIVCCDNKNVKVRNETISMLSTLYKHLGEATRKFLKGIKDSTLAVINSEFDKITPYQKGEFHSKREINNEEGKQEVGAEDDDPLASIPRADVGKDLGGQKLLNLINDKNWKKRKEAVDKMEAILEKANFRILPNGLSEIVGQIKVKLADSNKSVSKAFIQFVGKFAEALGPGAKQYAPMLIKPLLRCLSEKNTLVRNINLEAINKWSDAIGPENIINHVGKVIEKENPEIRSVLLEWILKHKDQIPNCEVSSLPKPLVEWLQDKAPAIRGMAEKVVAEVMPHSGPGAFKKLLKDLKPAVQNSVKPIIEKCIANSDFQDQEVEDEPPTTKNATKSKKDSKKESKKAAPQEEKKNLNSSTNRPKTAQVMTAKQIYEKLNKKKGGAGDGKSKDAEDGLVILDSGNKSKRNESDKKKRWHPEEIREDYITKFKSSTKTIFGDSMSTKMFSSDFKTLIKCIKLFHAALEDEEQFNQLLDVQDVIIKWGYIKSNEISNTSFLKELLMFYEDLADKLLEIQYEFMEAEGHIFCLCLSEKLGINNPILKEKIKETLIKVGAGVILYDPKKLISILMKGLNSKNTKSVSESLELIAVLIQTHRLDVINEKDVRIIGKIVDNPDNGIRQGALSACEEIYKIVDENFWELVGNKLSSKAEDIIRARFKAKLGVQMNSTPVEDKKNSSIRSSKSPMMKRDRSANKLQNSFNSSIGMGSAKSKYSNSKLNFIENRLGRNHDRDDQIKPVQSTSNMARSTIDPSEIKRRKESSVNRKLERISSNTRKQEALDSQLDQEISKMEESDEIKQEIELQNNDDYHELDENLDNIGKSIKQLKYGDLSGKVDALVIINEVITKKIDEAQDSLLRNSNFLIEAISRVFYDVFTKTPQKVPLKFGKYFISIVNKVCSIKDIMRHVDEHKVLILVEQLLLKLLMPGLDSLGDKGEGQAMFRNLNNTILRILEHWHPTVVFIVFLTLLKKYKGYDKIEKLPGIIVKCLLKVTRIMDQLIEIINIERIFLAIHEYLINKPISSSAKGDEVGIRITKTIVNEIVKIKKQSIWDFYGGVDAHTTQDIYIKKWIEIILMSMSGDDHSSKENSKSQIPDQNVYTGGLSMADHTKLMEIVKEACCGNQFRQDQAWKSILDFSNDYPSLDLDEYLKNNWAEDEYDHILSGIYKARKRKQIGGFSHKNVSSSFKNNSIVSGLKAPSRYGNNLNATGGRSNRLSTVDKLQEYEAKRANLRQKYGSKNSGNKFMSNAKSKAEANDDAKSNSNLKSENNSNLGSSIAAMNSSITEKWRKIHSKGNSGLNNTVGGNFKSSMQDNKSTLDKESNENEADTDPDKSNKTKLALQARLNEVKARLGKIKKNHDPR